LSDTARPALRALLFDLDGTLADTLPDLGAALAAAARDHGLAPPELAGMRHLVSFGGRRMVAEALGRAADDPLVEAVRHDFLRRYRAAIAERSRLFPGIGALIAGLEEAGLAWGVVTNKLGWLTTPLLAALGLRPGCVVCGDSAPRAKPHPDPLRLAADRLACPTGACAYLGDARNDVIAARAAGMRALVAGWGYLPADDPAEAWGAEAVIATPAGVLAWLARAARHRYP